MGFGSPQGHVVPSLHLGNYNSPIGLLNPISPVYIRPLVPVRTQVKLTWVYVDTLSHLLDKAYELEKGDVSFNSNLLLL